MDELNELFGELRAQLAEPPSHKAWVELCAIVELAAELAPAQVQTQWLPYIERAARQWPSPLRAYYLKHEQEKLTPAQALTIGICHHLYLSRSGLTATIEQLERIGELPRSIQAIMMMRPQDNEPDDERIKQLADALKLTIYQYELIEEEWAIYCARPELRAQLLDPQQRRRAVLLGHHDSGAELLLPPAELNDLLRRAQREPQTPLTELADTLYLRDLIHVARTSSATELRLLNLHQDDEVIELLIEAGCLNKIITLDLSVYSHTYIHQPKARQLAALFGACAPRLQRIDLSNHQLTDMHIEAIHAAISEQRLYTLDLSGCLSSLAQTEMLLNTPGIEGLRELHLNPSMLHNEPSNSSQLLFEIIARSAHLSSLEHLTLRSYCDGGFHRALNNLPNLKSMSWVSDHTSHQLRGKLLELEQYHVVRRRFAGTLKRYVTPSD